MEQLSFAHWALSIFGREKREKEQMVKERNWAAGGGIHYHTEF